MIKSFLKHALIFMLISSFPTVYGEHRAGKRNEILNSPCSSSELYRINDNSYPVSGSPYDNSLFNNQTIETPADHYLLEMQRNSLKSINNLYNEEDENQSSPPKLRIIPGGEPIQGVPVGNHLPVMIVFGILYSFIVITRKRLRKMRPFRICFILKIK